MHSTEMSRAILIREEQELWIKNFKVGFESNPNFPSSFRDRSIGVLPRIKPSHWSRQVECNQTSRVALVHYSKVQNSPNPSRCSFKLKTPAQCFKIVVGRMGWWVKWGGGSNGVFQLWWPELILVIDDTWPRSSHFTSLQNANRV